MSSLVRTVLDILARSVVLVALTEGVAELFFAANPDDDGLGTGLTAMFALVCAAAAWGLWDGFHRRPLRLCLTWAGVGALVFVGLTVFADLRYDRFSWSALADDLSDGLAFWTLLVFVPAVLLGILPSVLRRRDDAAATAYDGR